MATDQERIDDLQAASTLALRMISDLYSVLVDLKLLTTDQVTGLWRYSASQVGEGSPHLEIAVGQIVETMIQKLPPPAP